MHLGLDILGLLVEKQQRQGSIFGKIHMQVVIFVVIQVEVIMVPIGIERDIELGLKDGKKKANALKKRKPGNKR